jgi:hypothetical protein
MLVVDGGFRPGAMEHPHQCFFYWWNIARWWIFFSKMLILAIFFQKLIFLSPNFSSNLTIFYPFEQIFIKLWWFHPKSRWKCCTFYVIGSTRSINENKGRFLFIGAPWLAPSPDLETPPHGPFWVFKHYSIISFCSRNHGCDGSVAVWPTGPLFSMWIGVFSVNFHLLSVWYQWHKKCSTFI